MIGYLRAGKALVSKVTIKQVGGRGRRLGQSEAEKDEKKDGPTSTALHHCHFRKNSPVMPPKGKDFSRLKPQPAPTPTQEQQQPQTDASSTTSPNDASAAATTAASTSTSTTASVPASSTTTQPVARKVGKGKDFGRMQSSTTAPSTSQMSIQSPQSTSSSQPQPQQPPTASQSQPSLMQSSSNLIQHSSSDKNSQRDVTKIPSSAAAAAATATAQGGSVSQPLTAQQLAKQKQLRKYQQTLADKAKKLTRCVRVVDKENRSCRDSFSQYVLSHTQGADALGVEHFGLNESVLICSDKRVDEAAGFMSPN